jgi:hypothetical protein
MLRESVRAKDRRNAGRLETADPPLPDFLAPCGLLHRALLYLSGECLGRLEGGKIRRIREHVDMHKVVQTLS